RILSFYREKILHARPAMDSNTLKTTDRLQACQRLLADKLGLSSKLPTERILGHIRKIELDRFMQILPDIYMQDGHLRPQYLRMQLCISWLGFKLRYPPPSLRILKIESPQDLED